MQTEQLAELTQQVNKLTQDFEQHQRLATPSWVLRDEVTRLAAIVEGLAPTTTRGLSRCGGHEPISKFTRFRRHLVHRVLYLFRGR
jgi:hypothetical protein